MKQKHLYHKIHSKINELWNGYTPLGIVSDLVVEPELGSDSGVIGALVIGQSGP